MLEMAIISFFNAPFPTIAASDPEVAYSPTCGRIRNSALLYVFSSRREVWRLHTRSGTL